MLVRGNAIIGFGKTNREPVLVEEFGSDPRPLTPVAVSVAGVKARATHLLVSQCDEHLAAIGTDPLFNTVFAFHQEVDGAVERLTALLEEYATEPVILTGSNATSAHPRWAAHDDLGPHLDPTPLDLFAVCREYVNVLGHTVPNPVVAELESAAVERVLLDLYRARALRSVLEQTRRPA